MHFSNPPSNAKNGFTLLELSIVLVIIGLIVGGIMIGQTMIRSSELNSILADRDRYMASLAGFRLKYHAYPGDMNNAVDFWGSTGSCPNGTNPGTCNGNGNGRITIAAWTGPGETYRLWQHLGLSNMMPGKYTGLPASTSNIALVFDEDNMPRSRTSDTYSIEYRQYSDGNAKHRLVLYGTHPQTGGASPSDAAYIDEKADDGKPSSGAIRTTSTIPGNCITTIGGVDSYQINEIFSGCFLLMDME